MDATRIVIAHRLSTIHNADKICYLDQGKLVEMGNYEELMEQGRSLSPRWRAGRWCNGPARRYRSQELLARTALRLPRARDAPHTAPHDQPPLRRFPLDDEPHVARWMTYEQDARGRAPAPSSALQRRFVQLRFPITEGMSKDDAIAARRCADSSTPPTPTRRPRARLAATRSACRSKSHHCRPHSGHRHWPARGFRGVRARDDRAQRAGRRAAVDGRLHRQRPEQLGSRRAVSRAMGSGRRDAEERTSAPRPGAPSSAPAAAQKSRYQDRCIILSRGPYSAVSAQDALGLPEAEWLERSLVIRREHECTHYFTYRVFGAMRNNLLDELIADFVGIVRAFGTYRSELALRCLGLEHHDQYRAGRPPGELSRHPAALRRRVFGAAADRPPRRPQSGASVARDAATLSDL